MAIEDEDLRQQIEDVALMVNTAEDRKDDRDFLTKVHVAVDELHKRYRAMEEPLGEMDKMKLDRTFGRKVRDIRRLAGLLPRIGRVGPSTPDRREGAGAVGERMITGVSWQGNAAPERAPGSTSVGDEIEAYCGVCKESTTHNIVAMVGDAPKQVVCSMCNARHNYRKGPSKQAKKVEAKPAVDTRQREAERRAEEREREKRSKAAALADEIYMAEDVVPFDANRRYKVGEIIDHPEHGRGKIETVLRSSLLVRFANGGMKSVMLV